MGRIADFLCYLQMCIIGRGGGGGGAKRKRITMCMSRC